MERLTEKSYDEYDAVWVKDHDYVSAAHRLADYEDTGLTPEEINKMNDFINSQIAKLLAENQALRVRIEQVERERDSLITRATEDIQKANDMGKCHTCIHQLADRKEKERYCNKWPNRDCFKWRGLEGEQ